MTWNKWTLKISVLIFGVLRIDIDFQTYLKPLLVRLLRLVNKKRKQKQRRRWRSVRCYTLVPGRGNSSARRGKVPTESIHNWHFLKDLIFFYLLSVIKWGFFFFFFFFLKKTSFQGQWKKFLESISYSKLPMFWIVSLWYW